LGIRLFSIHCYQGGTPIRYPLLPRFLLVQLESWIGGLKMTITIEIDHDLLMLIVYIVMAWSVTRVIQTYLESGEGDE